MTTNTNLESGENEEYSSIFPSFEDILHRGTSTASSFVIGYLYGGLPIATVFAIGGLVDEVLVSYGISARYYLTPAALGAFTAAKLSKTSPYHVIEIIGASTALAAATGHFNRIISQFIPSEVDNIVRSVIDDESFDLIKQRMILASTTTTFGIMKILDDHFDNRGRLLTAISTANLNLGFDVQYSRNLLNGFMKSTGLIAASVAIKSASQVIFNHYFTVDSIQQTEKIIVNKIYKSRESLARFNNHTSSSVIEKNLPSDIANMIKTTTILQTSKIEQYLNAYIAVAFFIETRVVTVPLILCLYSLINVVPWYLNSKITEYAHKEKTHDAAIVDLQKIMADAQNHSDFFLAKTRLEHELEQRHQNSNDINFYKIPNDILAKYKPWLLDNIMGQACVALVLFTTLHKNTAWYSWLGGNLYDQLSSADRNTVSDARTYIMMRSYSIVMVLEWFGKSSAETGSVDSSLNRIKTAIDWLNEEEIDCFAMISNNSSANDTEVAGNITEFAIEA